MFVYQDYIANMNGAPVGCGTVGSTLGMVRFDPGYLRPYWDKNGDASVTINTGRTTLDKGEQRPIREHRRIKDIWGRGTMHPVMNATTLRKEEWLEYDRVVLRAARYRLRFWADLSAANSYGGFNGMGKLILEHETMSDPGEAMMDMNGVTEGRDDNPLFQLEGLPLPITHSDFFIDARTLAASRNGGMPLDTTKGEGAGRRVGEMIEKVATGVTTGVTYGGNSTQVGGYGRTSKVYGLVNFPSRLTKTNAYRPTGNGRSGTGWVPADTLKDVLAAIDQLRANKFYGPFVIYTSNDWDQYLDNDYILSGGNVATQTLRNRLRAIDGVQDVKRLDFLFASAPAASTGPGGEALNGTYPFRMEFVQMTPDVCRAVNGLDLTTVQWEERGGMLLKFKILAIQVPQLRSDYYGNAGLLDLSATL